MGLLPPLLDEKRAVSYAIVFGIWAEVFLYCVLHDQYLVTQTIQLTCYTAGGTVGLLFLAWIVLQRRKVV